MNPKLHFLRYEFKYLITPEQEKIILKRIMPYVVPDPFTKDSKGGAYEVISLYYDSPCFYYYQQKLDGVQRRKKVRLRTYRNDGKFSANVFFELKRKHDAVILKDRFIMSKEDYLDLVKNNNFYGKAIAYSQEKEDIIKEFEWEKNLRSITPKILVAYDRLPFVGKYNENFRITFDKNIKAMENDNLFYTGNDMTDVSGNYTVMEIKFNGSIPFYLVEIIKEFNLERTPFSKYCNGVDVCGSLSLFGFSRPFNISKLNEDIKNISNIRQNLSKLI